MTAALLPPNATALERAAADAIGARADMGVPVRDLWSPERCPAPLLPWLAWALSVDVWDDAWPEATRRRVIAESLSIHRIKGSRASVERAIAAMGLGEVTIVEGVDAIFYDGGSLHDGQQDYGLPHFWWEYRVYVRRLLSIAQADQMRAALAAVQPLRCRLAEVWFVEAAALYDGQRLYDGTYSHGVA